MLRAPPKENCCAQARPRRGTSSHQERSMEKAHGYPFGLSSSTLDEAFQRAQAELRAADAAASAEANASGADECRDDDFPERWLLGHELLLAVREPIAWLLALTRRLATGDPEDTAAVDRLTAAFHSSLARDGIGVRASDALTVFGILVGALDPRVVLASATKTIADGVATILACEGAALAAEIARFAEEIPTAVYTARVPRTHSRRAARANHTR
ncbi:MAG: hypothetical protein ABIY55_20390 [Kofleriaceae bacterium]